MTEHVGEWIDKPSWSGQDDTACIRCSCVQAAPGGHPMTPEERRVIDAAVAWVAARETARVKFDVPSTSRALFSAVDAYLGSAGLAAPATPPCPPTCPGHTGYGEHCAPQRQAAVPAEPEIRLRGTASTPGPDGMTTLWMRTDTHIPYQVRVPSEVVRRAERVDQGEGQP